MKLSQIIFICSSMSEMCYQRSIYKNILSKVYGDGQKNLQHGGFFVLAFVNL